MDESSLEYRLWVSLSHNLAKVQALLAHSARARRFSHPDPTVTEVVTHRDCAMMDIRGLAQRGYLPATILDTLMRYEVSDVNLQVQSTLFAQCNEHIKAAIGPEYDANAERGQ